MIFYLSPHPDDVAFSCGGSVAADVAGGERVVLVTVFTPRHAADLRAREDRVAAASLGCEHAELGLPETRELSESSDANEINDSQDATSADVSTRDRGLGLFAPLGPADLSWLREVVVKLGEIIPAGAQVVAPLGVGGHIDHRLVQAAARSLLEDRPLTLSFYEDLPYALPPYALGRRMAALGARLSGSPEPALLRGTWAAEVRAQARALSAQPMGRALGPPGLRWLMRLLAARAMVAADDPRSRLGPAPVLRPLLRDVSTHAARRFAACAAYASQWPLFFASSAAMEQALRRYGQSLLPVPDADDAGACLHERLWIEVR